MEYSHVFNEAFDEMIVVLNKGEYIHCSQIASDMVRFAIQSKLKQETFMNEIIGDACDTIDVIHNHYELPQNFKDEYHTLTLNCFKEVISKYKNKKDVLEQYKALEELQYTISQFKFISFRKYSHLHKPHEGV